MYVCGLSDAAQCNIFNVIMQRPLSKESPIDCVHYLIPHGGYGSGKELIPANPIPVRVVYLSD